MMTMISNFTMCQINWAAEASNSRRNINPNKGEVRTTWTRTLKVENQMKINIAITKATTWII